MKKYLIIFLLIFIPLQVFGQFGVNYPVSPVTQETISQNSTLGETIKYIVSWVILIGAVVVFGSLVAAGIQYLTSMGEPRRISDAKNRIINSFIGFVILLGSYIILMTINPQLTVMEIRREPINVERLIVSEENIINTESTPEEKEEEIKEGKAKPLLQSAKEIIKGIFKKKKGGSIKAVNFKDFPIKGLVLSDKDKEYKIIFYQYENFKGEAKEFIKEKGVKEFVPIISYDENDLKYSFISELKGREVEEDGEVRKITENDYHDFDSKEGIIAPPLSMRIIGIGPGVYLYSWDGDQRYLTRSVSDLGSSEISFGDKTTAVEIKNDIGDDFLAILFDHDDFENRFRLFFEKKIRETVIENSGKYSYQKKSIGNTLSEEKTFITELGKEDKEVLSDRYGKVKKPSSVAILRLDEADACKEVRLCTTPEFAGDCLVYLSPGQEIDWGEERVNVGIYKQAMPLYETTNIPQEKVTVNYKDEEDYEDLKTREVEFDDHIYSIKIKGNCLVNLFENTITSNEWDRGEPGTHSENFISSKTTLVGHPITDCMPWWKELFRKIDTESCVSSISVFPIEPLK